MSRPVQSPWKLNFGVPSSNMTESHFDGDFFFGAFFACSILSPLVVFVTFTLRFGFQERSSDQATFLTGFYKFTLGVQAHVRLKRVDVFPCALFNPVVCYDVKCIFGLCFDTFRTLRPAIESMPVCPTFTTYSCSH